MHPLIAIPIFFASWLSIALLTSLFIKHATKTTIQMTDLLYIAATIGFFALMLGFAWACEKV